MNSHNVPVLATTLALLLRAASPAPATQGAAQSKPRSTPIPRAKGSAAPNTHKQSGSAPLELKDWQTDLSAFVAHVESVRTSPADAAKVSMMDNMLYFALMTSAGGCASKDPTDRDFGPRVRFTGTFKGISPATENQRKQQKASHVAELSFPDTSPGAAVNIFPSSKDLVAWQGLTAGSTVRFEADLNCLIGMAVPNGRIVYSLTLKNAKVVDSQPEAVTPTP